MSARTSSHVDFPIRVMSLADIARQSIKIQWVLLARPLRASRPDHKAGSVADPARPPNIIPNVRKIDAPRDWESVPEFDSISSRSLPGRRRIDRASIWSDRALSGSIGRSNAWHATNTGAKTRGIDQLHDALMAHQWLATPVLGDKREQAVLDLVPFAGAGWKWGGLVIPTRQPC
jgi:hypothetical protein